MEAITSMIRDLACAAGLSLGGGGVIFGVGIEFGKAILQLTVHLVSILFALLWFVLSLCWVGLTVISAGLYEQYVAAGLVTTAVICAGAILVIIRRAARVRQTFGNAGDECKAGKPRAKDTNHRRVSTPLRTKKERQTPPKIRDNMRTHPKTEPTSRSEPTLPKPWSRRDGSQVATSREYSNQQCRGTPKEYKVISDFEPSSIEFDELELERVVSDDEVLYEPPPEYTSPVQRGSSGVGVFDSYDQTRYRDYLASHTDEELLRQLNSKEGKVKYSAVSLATSALSTAATAHIAPWSVLLTLRKRKVNKKKLQDIKEAVSARGLHMDQDAGGWVKAGAKVAVRKVGVSVVKGVVRHIIT